MNLPLILLALFVAPPQEPAAQPAVTPAPLRAPSASIDAGLAAFKKHRFRTAEGEFQKALDADPQSAAAHFYLGYTLYKIAEPSRRFGPGKQRAAEEFARCYAIDPSFAPVWRRRAP
jgi:Tfp pilus assembly protein PilF